jgi:phage-related protein (TIGR01555 family)
MRSFVRNLFNKKLAKDSAKDSATDSVNPEVNERTGAFFSNARTKEREALLANWCREKAFIKPDITSLSGSAQDSDLSSFETRAKNIFSLNDSYVPIPVLRWYIAQGFLSYQTCSVIAQQWLVSKACAAKGKDAVRNGWDINVTGDTGGDDSIIERVKRLDKKFKVRKNLVEAHKFNNVFGIRHVLIKVDSSDKQYYEKPFSVEAIKPGTYKGLSQIDPYWLAPELSQSAISDPSSLDFYEPTYWTVNGVKIHKSHFIILRGEEVSDVLKPSYRYGGVSMVQQIYERVYAAERTANEAPELALTKRLYTRTMDMDAAIKNQDAFEEALQYQTEMKNNHGFLAVGKGEDVTQLETTLSDFDTTVMTQYQLVASIAKVPATRLLGTSPKGFNATGEHEIKTYHEELESVQVNDFDDILERHYECLSASALNGVRVTHAWRPVAMPSETEQATLNATKAQTDKLYFDMGAVTPYEVRDRVRLDDKSGYNELEKIEEPEYEDEPEALVPNEPEPPRVPDEPPPEASADVGYEPQASDEITKENGEFWVTSKAGKKLDGPFPSYRKAKNRLGEIEHFAGKGDGEKAKN